MKKLAARDFEDLLQVFLHNLTLQSMFTLKRAQNMIPVVEDTLPEPHNSNLMVLLYRLAEWHALAKLRMHTEVTLGYLEIATTVIGKELRSFRDTIGAAYTCKELPGETARRTRRQRKKKKHSKEMEGILISNPPESLPTSIPSSSRLPHDHLPTPPVNTSQPAPTTVPSPPDLPPKTKLLNLGTYKLHALGDYVRTIRLFGTTDSYSTQIVSIFRP